MKNISLIIPNYTRTSILLESFSNVLDDDRINEIIINDDDSHNFDQVKNLISSLENKKIKLFKNEKNLGTFFNKLDAVKKATNQWGILLDSDNVIDKLYIDNIYSREWLSNKIICPEKLLHHPQNCLGAKDSIFFNYELYKNHKVNFDFCSKNFEMQHLSTLLNTGNFFINCDSYINSFEKNPFNRNIDIADVAFFNFLFLKSNPDNYLEVSDGLEYIHRVHDGSFYLNNQHLSTPANHFLRSLFKLEMVINL